jgi:hypothetical protein
MIRPYPSLPNNISQTPSPPLCRESICDYLVTKNHIGLAEREIPVLVYGFYDFPRPYVQGLPIVDDPADRSCRYLVYPPTVPSVTRLQGYQRPPRGGRDMCRRAYELTPFRGRRRCAAGGLLVT